MTAAQLDTLRERYKQAARDLRIVEAHLLCDLREVREKLDNARTAHLLACRNYDTARDEWLDAAQEESLRRVLAHERFES